MNLKIRARSAVERAMPKPLMRKLIGDEWIEELVMSVYGYMKAVEKDARRCALNDAANAVGDYVDGGSRHPAFKAVMDLHQRKK